MAKHILSVLVNNHAGVLNRVTGLFSRRGFNIDSLSVATTERSDTSRITIVVDGDDYTVDQVMKQLNKLIDVVKVKLLDPSVSIGREMCFVKVEANRDTRMQIVEITNIFRAKIVDASSDSFTIELTGTSDKIDAFFEMVKPYNVIEMVRTGLMAIERGSNTIY